MKNFLSITATALMALTTSACGSHAPTIAVSEVTSPAQNTVTAPPAITLLASDLHALADHVSDRVLSESQSHGSASSTVSVAACGEITISGHFDELLTTDAGSLETLGCFNLMFKPEGGQTLAGSLQLSTSVELTKGTASEVFTVTSNGLHVSACGLDQGSIEFVSPTHDFVLNFTGCGQSTLTDQGTPVIPGTGTLSCQQIDPAPAS